MLNAKYLRSILRYDPLTGDFTRLIRKGPYAAGKIAGCSSGYINIMIDYKLIRAHRLAWLYMTGKWPPDDKQIDHKNRIRTDNRWENLRLATRSQNSHNTGTRRNNTSGQRGVCFIKPRNKWRAYICVERRNRYLGEFGTLEQASIARQLAEQQHINN